MAQRADCDIDCESDEKSEETIRKRGTQSSSCIKERGASDESEQGDKAGERIKRGEEKEKHTGRKRRKLGRSNSSRSNGDASVDEDIGSTGRVRDYEFSQ